MSDGWHLDRYDTGYQHGWIEAIEAALEAIDKGGRAEQQIRALLDEAREP